MLTIGPRDPDGDRWLATLTVMDMPPQVFVLAPVATWRDIVDHEITFEADEVRVPPAILRALTEAGAGPGSHLA